MSAPRHPHPGRKVLLAAILAAASGIFRPATAQLRPTAHDFGDSPPGGNDGTRREFRLPARARADLDDVVIGFSGPDAEAFKVSEKGCSYVGSPDCLIRVMFVPRSYGRKVAIMSVSDPGGSLGTASLTGNAVVGCMPVHVSCNYAGNFNGSVVWTEGLNHSNLGSGRTVSRTVRGMVEIRAGVASCNGAVSERTVTPRMGESSFSATITGDGIAIVEFGTGTDDDDRQTWYSITVVCPRAGATLTSKDYQTGEVKTTTSSPVPGPAEMGHNEVNSYKQADSGQRVIFKGSTSDIHPDADPENGTQGVITMAWSLARIDRPLPPAAEPPPAPPPGSVEEGVGRMPLIRIRLVVAPLRAASPGETMNTR